MNVLATCICGPKCRPLIEGLGSVRRRYSHYSKLRRNAQTLVNLNVAWCRWAGMTLRIDKCISFGMRKQERSYQQYHPNHTINDEKIPAQELASSFKYLLKLFGLERNLTEEKAHLMDQVTSYLNTTSHLNIK